MSLLFFLNSAISLYFVRIFFQFELENGDAVMIDRNKFAIACALCPGILWVTQRFDCDASRGCAANDQIYVSFCLNDIGLA